MADDRVFPDDFTYGFGGHARQPAHIPMPITLHGSPMTPFEAKRWCIEQVVTVRAKTPPPYNLRLDEEAAALFAFLCDPVPA